MRILTILAAALLLVSIAATPPQVRVHPVIVAPGMPTVYLVELPDLEPGTWAGWKEGEILGAKEGIGSAILVVSHAGENQVRRLVVQRIYALNE